MRVIDLIERLKSIEEFEALLERGEITANSMLHHYNDSYKTRLPLLHHACIYPWPEGIALLMLYGADPYVAIVKTGLTPIGSIANRWARDDTDWEGAYCMALVNLTGQRIGPNYPSWVSERVGRNANAPLNPIFYPTIPMRLPLSMPAEVGTNGVSAG